jgi:hypothetical protein
MDLHMGIKDIAAMQNPPLSESRAYLKRVMRETGLDVTNLARKAKVDPSTLTRAYNDLGWKTRLSLTTLRKIQDSTGIEMPPGMDPNPPRKPGRRESDLAVEIYDLMPAEGRVLTKEEKRRSTKDLLDLLRKHGLI